MAHFVLLIQRDCLILSLLALSLWDLPEFVHSTLRLLMLRGLSLGLAAYSLYSFPACVLRFLHLIRSVSCHLLQVGFAF